ncbi:MAG: hypothetical protein ABSC94_05045 [Polyangiaceae bacterium]|jgi:hypothetical protein
MLGALLRSRAGGYVGGACLFAVGLSPACTSPMVSGALDPRFVAVHNTLASLGMAEVGPIQEGVLAEGREARVSLPLPGGCITVVAVGGDGFRDIDAALLDPRGAPIAHDVTQEPLAVLRPCLEAADTYVLVVKAAAGGGSWVAATWAGGVGAVPSSMPTPAPAAEANGTCRAPIPLAPGTVSGSTTHGEHENAGSCGPSDSRELVYELDVIQRERVTIEVEARFDSVLYVRKDDCSEAGAEVECNDDGPDRTHSRIERVLDPGKYFVFVDGYGHEAGSFKMTVTAAEVLALTDTCRRASPLLDGVVTAGTTAGLADNARASCGGGAEGGDAAWYADVNRRSRVRVVERSNAMAPVIHVRRACADELSEVGCGESGAGAGEASWVGLFDPGRYAVFADSHDRDRGGAYTLLLETAPLGGAGAASDACGDAQRLPAGPTGSMNGDTFAARDDVAGTCGGVGAPDLVYRLDVARTSRLVVSVDGEEAPHLLVAWRRCGDRSAEVGCGRALSEIVPAGTYYLGVDGSSPGAMGRFTIHWSLRDVTGQAAACMQAASLTERRPLTASTVGAGDRFEASCGPEAGASGADRVFQMVVRTRSTVHVSLKAPTFQAILALRKACVDAARGPLPELACAQATDSGHKATMERVLEAGTYWLLVDGASTQEAGPFTLEYRVIH